MYAKYIKRKFYGWVNFSIIMIDFIELCVCVCVCVCGGGGGGGGGDLSTSNPKKLIKN